MRNYYITEISRYVIGILVMAYSITGFLVFIHREETQRKAVYAVQVVLLFAAGLACFAEIMAKTGSVDYLFLFAFMLVVFFAVIELFRMLYPDGNRLVVNNMCLLLMFGIIMISRISYDKALRQFVIAGVSLAIGLAIPAIFYRLAFLRDLWPLYAVIGIAGLGIVLIHGSVTHGSKLSYTIGGLTFQPSEFIKILFIMCVAGLLKDGAGLIRVLLSGLIAASHVLILVFSKDLGSALIFFVVYLSMIFVASGNILYIAAGVTAGAAASAVAYRIFPHIRKRVRAFVDPWSEIDSTGYQVTQALFGISSGGAFGLGLYNGAPDDIPYVERDAIFAGISEEFGLTVSVALTLICLSMFIMILYEGSRIKDGFSRLIAVGCGVTFIFQIFLTIGGVTKFIPLTGVTLPLVSYGGTSALVSIWMLSLFEGVCLVGSEERYSEE